MFLYRAENLLKHCFGQTPGLRVVAAAMIGIYQTQILTDRVLNAVSKSKRRKLVAQRPENGPMCDGSPVRLRYPGATDSLIRLQEIHYTYPPPV